MIELEDRTINRFIMIGRFRSTRYRVVCGLLKRISQLLQRTLIVKQLPVEDLANERS